MEKTSFFGKPPFLSLLAFITFVNYEHAYLVEKFLHILFSHSAFGKNEKRNKTRSLLKRQLFAECYLIIIYVLQNKESKKPLFRIHLPVKLIYGKMSIKKGKFSSYPFSYLIYKVFILSNHRWLEKMNSFHER